MSPDLGALRLRALTVPGVICLADHHDGVHPSPRPTSRNALRVVDQHIEIDVVLAAGHAVTATTRALRAALSPLLSGRNIRVTVMDLDGVVEHRSARRGRLEPWPESQDERSAGPLVRTRVAAREVLALLETSRTEGPAAAHRGAVTGICRMLTAFDVDPVSRRVLVRELREHLTAGLGHTGRGLVDRIDAIDDVD